MDQLKDRQKRSTREHRKANTLRPAQRPKRSRREYDLIDHSKTGKRWLEFPQMKGRVVEKIEFYSSADYNTISVVFADKTSLNLDIEILMPQFEIRADLEGSRDGNLRVIKKWPAIRSES